MTHQPVPAAALVVTHEQIRSPAWMPGLVNPLRARAAQKLVPVLAVDFYAKPAKEPAGV